MQQLRLIEEELSRSVIGAFFEVYNTLGFGFLEDVYIKAMQRELHARGHKADRQIPIPIMYKGTRLSTQRLDMIVDDTLIVEAKSTLILHPIARRQLYSYLKATSLQVGLLLHFGPKASFYRQVLTTAEKNYADRTDSADLADRKADS